MKGKERWDERIERGAREDDIHIKIERGRDIKGDDERGRTDHIQLGGRVASISLVRCL